jgi:hypothetical protein
MAAGDAAPDPPRHLRLDFCRLLSSGGANLPRSRHTYDQPLMHPVLIAARRRRGGNCSPTCHRRDRFLDYASNFISLAKRRRSERNVNSSEGRARHTVCRASGGAFVGRCNARDASAGLCLSRLYGTCLVGSDAHRSPRWASGLRLLRHARTLRGGRPIRVGQGIEQFNVVARQKSRRHERPCVRVVRPDEHSDELVPRRGHVR